MPADRPPDPAEAAREAIDREARDWFRGHRGRSREMLIAHVRTATARAIAEEINKTPHSLVMECAIGIALDYADEPEASEAEQDRAIEEMNMPQRKDPPMQTTPFDVDRRARELSSLVTNFFRDARALTIDCSLQLAREAVEAAVLEKDAELAKLRDELRRADMRKGIGDITNTLAEVTARKVVEALLPPRAEPAPVTNEPLANTLGLDRASGSTTGSPGEGNLGPASTPDALAQLEAWLFGGDDSRAAQVKFSGMTWTCTLGDAEIDLERSGSSLSAAILSALAAAAPPATESSREELFLMALRNDLGHITQTDIALRITRRLEAIARSRAQGEVTR